MAEIISGKSNQVRYKPLNIVGIGHVEQTNESYLITLDDLKHLEKLIEKDKKQLAKVRSLEELAKVDPEAKKKIDEIKAKMRKNPVNELGKEIFPNDDTPSNFAKGFLSVGGYLYAFGDFAARYTGFRDWQECHGSVVEGLECSSEEDKLDQDIEFSKKISKIIATNERGLGVHFIKSVKKYMQQNKMYFIGRAVGTNVIASRVTNKTWVEYTTKNEYFGKQRDIKLFNKAAIPVGLAGSYMDALFYLRNIDTAVTIDEITPEIIDLYAKYIILGQ